MSEHDDRPAGYNRPQQLWQCDDENCGACPLGSNAWGRCRSATPGCRPRLSLRGKRNVFTGCITLLIVGLLLTGLWSNRRLELISPGPLSTAHASVMNAVAGDDRCSACHDVGSDPMSWLSDAIRVKAGHEVQSQRCVKCHTHSIPADHALAAHNLPAAELTKLSAKAAERQSGALDVLNVKFTQRHDVACSTCHREHHGTQFNMTALTDRQCQSCHQGTFASFEHGHPEFRNVQSKRRSSIAFDHASHAGKHFASKQTKFDCNQCHLDDGARNVKRLASFEQSCAACHTKPIEAAGMEGIVAFALPVLDVAKLNAAGHSVGAWPENAQGDFDGTLSPLMRMLLRADDSLASVFNTLGDEEDLRTLTESQEITELAWGMKRLLAELADDAERTIERRLTVTLHRTPTTSELKAVTRHLPPAMFAEARRRWFPNLSEELSKRKSLQTVSHPSRFTVPFLQVRGDVASGKDQEKIPGVTWWSKADQPPSGDTTLLSENPLRKHYAQPAASPANAPTANVQGELLAENPLTKFFAASPPIAETKPVPVEAVEIQVAPVESRPVVEETPIAEPVPEIVAQAELPPVVTAEAEERPEKKETPAIDLVSTGAWVLDDASSSIRYRPSGHADPLLKTLLDLAASAKHEKKQGSSLAHLLQETAMKSCTSCHSIDRRDGAYAVNWQADSRSADRREFTKFSHRPHIGQPKLSDCSSCHMLNAASNVMANFETTHTLAYEHDFQPIVKASCVSCHTSGAAGSHCTQCHNYHVGSAVNADSP